MEKNIFIVSYTVGRWPNLRERKFNFTSYIDALKYANMLRRFAANEPTIKSSYN